MSALALQCCPNCRRNVAAEARVCRACYKVLPRKKKKKEELVSGSPLRGLLAGPVWVITVAAIAAGLWWARVDIGLVPPTGAEQGGAPGGAGFFSPSRGLNAQITSSGTPALHWSVLRKDGTCILTQGIRNVGAAEATRAVFHIQFRDSGGSAIGDPAPLARRIALSPAQEEHLELVAPCPTQTVGAEVVIRDPDTTTNTEPKLELLATSFSGHRSLSSNNISALVVEVADQSICPPPDKCELKVTFGEGREASYWFQRDEHNPVFLVNYNSIIIGHLLGKMPATLHLEEDLNTTTISLTHNNIDEGAPPSFLEKVRDLLPWRLGDGG